MDGLALFKRSLKSFDPVWDTRHVSIIAKQRLRLA
jgi:hypothetical protein